MVYMNSFESNFATMRAKFKIALQDDQTNVLDIISAWKWENYANEAQFLNLKEVKGGWTIELPLTDLKLQTSANRLLIANL